jgi:hypothetical protein
MNIVCRCEKCGHVYVQDAEDLTLEFDFRDKTITFFCRDKKCNHENIMDLKPWIEQQRQSPLPKIKAW